MGAHVVGRPFIISVQTLLELESIKTSRAKDESVRYRARQMTHYLDSTHDSDFYHVSNATDYLNDDACPFRSTLPNTPDSIIIYAAWKAYSQYQDMIFCTDDLCCKHLASSLAHLPVCSSKDLLPRQSYTGFLEVTPTNEQYAALYEQPERNTFGLIPNQYLIAHSPAAGSVQAFKWADGKHVAVDYKPFKTQAFGAVRAKEKDIYQMLAFDSLLHNQITMLCGPAGTGKSYLALAHMLKLLETHKIDKIIVFTNPCATSGAARLGFYPGTRDEKLLDSQIGNMLGAKLGDTMELQRYIDANKIQLLPFSDLRGFDTTGMNCAVYITEAQNLDIEMMRLALQRIGEDSICIIDGDYDAQVDLDIYSGDNNGMRRLSQVFRGQDFYGEVKLQKIYRSRIAALAQEM